MTSTLAPAKHKSHTADHPSDVAEPSASPSASRWSRLWTWTQFLLCLVLTAGVLAYLLRTPAGGSSAVADHQGSQGEETVRLVGPKCISIQPDCPLCRKLQVTAVQATKITAPVLTVTGTVVASLRPSSGEQTDYWQFNSPELLTIFTDWQTGTSDVAFHETLVAQTRQLADTRVDAQQKLVERMRKLVEAGTDTERDLAAAETELIQAQIEGRKEVHEAETALRLAQRTEAALARQLQQAGLEPDMLRSVASELDIVVADVPEGFVSRVRLGQGCEARFFGFPDQPFSGKVRAIAPVLSQERRSLRVLFAISDPGDQLRPGMFADIGLGTDARNAILVPAEGIVHVGRSDYVLVRGRSDDWRVTEVQVGELHETGVEIVGGLQAGDRVAGRGVILLKPYIIEALQTSSSTEALQARAQCTLGGER